MNDLTKGYYGLDELVLNINITINRGDALGIYIIARELASRVLSSLKNMTLTKIKKELHL